MTPFITKNNSGKSVKRVLFRAAALAFWLLVWQGASEFVGQEILLVSPARVLREVGVLCITGEFWLSLLASFGRILCGFLLAQVLGSVMAVLACRSRFAEELFYPLVTVVKATPVASFTVLALIWIRSEDLSILISTLMAFPIVYQNLCEGIRSVDRKLLEMAAVFRVGWLRRGLYLYLPAALPYILSSASLSAGLCWKSGIAAEVIGLPARSIGSALYESKLFFDTPSMFAWTLVIVLISVLLERTVTALIRALRHRLEKG